ncbi:MAG: helix-turn-helix domain-containing protein [Gaiellaceae bacterium]
MDQEENELRRRIAKRLRLARLTAELTQDELGHAAGVSRSFISLVEHGARGIDVYRLRRLALAAGTTLAALIEEPAPPEGRD